MRNALAAATLLLCLIQAGTAQTHNPLRIPDTLSGTTFDLTVAHSMHQFFSSGKSTPTSAINGSWWGPTLIFNKGDNVRLNVINTLMDSTTMHWHGFHIPPVMDGGPHQPIPPGTTWSPSFTVMNNAATYWYHPHLHMMTEEQLTQGTGGLIIVRDPHESSLPLPRRYGIDDIPLVLTDRTFNASNELVTVHYGDTMVVNGTLDAGITLPAQVVRFRVLDAATERSYNIGFSDNRTFYVITSDGGLLDAPVPVTRYLLSVGERIEILVDLSNAKGTATTLRAYNSGFARDIPGSEPVNFPVFGNKLGLRDFDILHIDVGDATDGAITAIPASLTHNTFPEAASATNTRTITIVETPPTPGKGAGFLLDGKAFDMETINHTVPLNSTEIWEIVNGSNLAHPFHIHDVQFAILSRNGAAPPAYERGWKDVVLVRAHETVRFIARFEDFADAEHPFMYHCHIALHEDDGMMGQFLVIPPSTGVTAEPSAVNARLTLSPNPTTGTLRVVTGAGAARRPFEIVNGMGDCVMKGTLDADQATLDVSGLPTGIYFVRTMGDDAEVARFVKQ